MKPFYAPIKASIPQYVPNYGGTNKFPISAWIAQLLDQYVIRIH